MAALWIILALAAFSTALIAPGLGLGQSLQSLAFVLGLGFSLLWVRQLLALRRLRTKRKVILIDGSNVIHWNNGTPDIRVLFKVVQALVANKYQPGVIFDANVGYKLADHYMNEASLAQQLGIEKKQVMVSPKGEPADRFLLQAARDMEASIVTNDRFRDWHEAFPEFARPGRLIHGGYRDGAPYLRQSKGEPV